MTGSENQLIPWQNWHIWLADGIKEIYIEHWVDNETCEDPYYGTSPASCGVCPFCVTCYYYHPIEWHMNWGWGGQSNGWYNASHFTIGDYEHYMRAYSNIRP